jgi:hypothetical protein
LGPLNLNLLGLVVSLNEVVLDIGAQPGAGNVIGNLLANIVNLLNSDAALSSVAAALNQLVSALQ